MSAKPTRAQIVDAAVIELRQLGVPESWIQEIRKWPEQYINLYLYQYRRGDMSAASRVVAEARQSPYLYTSDGQWVHPNAEWFGQLSSAERQQYLVPANSAEADALMSSGNPAQGPGAGNPSAPVKQPLTPSPPILNQPVPGQAPSGQQGPAGAAPPGVNVPPSTGQQPTQPYPTTNTNNPYTQDQDFLAFSDPQGAVGAQLRGAGWNTAGNPLAQRALRQSSVAPYQHQLVNGWNSDPNGMNQWLSGWINARNTPGQRGMTFAQGSQAFNNAIQGGGEGWEAILAPEGASGQEQLQNVGTYLAASIADNVNPIAQQAYQTMLKNQNNTWNDAIFGSGTGGYTGSFVDWLQDNNWTI